MIKKTKRSPTERYEVMARVIIEQELPQKFVGSDTFPAKVVRFGPFEMPAVPQVGDRIEGDGFEGQVAQVSWTPGDDEVDVVVLIRP